MGAMVFFPVLQIGQVGAMLILAASLIAAILGIVAFTWAMVLLWRENNPQGVIMRGQTRLVEDVDEDDLLIVKGPKEKLLTWVNR